jgi:transcription elongation GreA/GreB family factor
MNQTDLKKKLVDACIKVIEDKSLNLDSELEMIQKSANEETKSSAGDKYETGRAMLMLEKEKLLGQKEQLFQQIKPLKSIDVNKLSKKVELGSIVITSQSNYFIASGVGQIRIDDDMYLVISAMAPIAQGLLDKTPGEKTEFNGKSIKIYEIF